MIKLTNAHTGQPAWHNSRFFVNMREVTIEGVPATMIWVDAALPGTPVIFLYASESPTEITTLINGAANA